MFIIYFYRPFSNSQNHQSATHITMIFHVFLCYIYISIHICPIYSYIIDTTDYIPKRLYSYISIYTDISIDYIPIIFLYMSYIFLRILYMSILGIVGARNVAFSASSLACSKRWIRASARASELGVKINGYDQWEY